VLSALGEDIDSGSVLKGLKEKLVHITL
jgi:hypothetical protein